MYAGYKLDVKNNEEPKSVPSDQIRSTNHSGKLDWLLTIVELLIKQISRPSTQDKVKK